MTSRMRLWFTIACRNVIDVLCGFVSVKKIVKVFKWLVDAWTIPAPNDGHPKLSKPDNVLYRVMLCCLFGISFPRIWSWRNVLVFGFFIFFELSVNNLKFFFNIKMIWLYFVLCWLFSHPHIYLNIVWTVSYLWIRSLVMFIVYSPFTKFYFMLVIYHECYRLPASQQATHCFSNFSTHCN